MHAAKAHFDWQDPFNLDGQLSEEERMVRDTARAYALDKLLPRVQDAFRHEKTDPSIFVEMGELGLLGPTVSEKYGGAGRNYVSYGLIVREIEHIDSGYRSMMSVQSSLVIVPIHTFGSDERKRRYLPGLTAGTQIGCFGLTEPDHGSEPGSMATRARKAEGGFLLSGVDGDWHEPLVCNAIGIMQKDAFEDMDLQFADRRCLRRLGQDRRRRYPGLRTGEGLEGPLRPRHTRQGRPARLHNRPDRHGRRVRSGRKHAAGCCRPEGTFHLPEHCPLRHCPGRVGAAESCYSTATSSVVRSRPTSSFRRSWPT